MTQDRDGACAEIPDIEIPHTEIPHTETLTSIATMIVTPERLLGVFSRSLKEMSEAIGADKRYAAMAAIADTDAYLMESLSGARLNRRSAEIMALCLSVMTAARDRGALKPAPHGADRGIEAVIAWNAFVDGGVVAISRFEIDALLSAPLPAAVRGAILQGGADAIGDLRVARAKSRYDREPSQAIAGDPTKGPMVLLDGDLDVIAHAVAARVAAVMSGHARALNSEGFICPRTDCRLIWKDDALAAPIVLEIAADPAAICADRLAPLGPWTAPRPIRHVALKTSSGVIAFADWFRVGGFTKGMAALVDDGLRSGPSISSDAGVDLRTRETLRRTGLMRIHTTNCSVSVLADASGTDSGDVVSPEPWIYRIAMVDEDHATLWDEVPSITEGDEHDYAPSAAARELEASGPRNVGQICCDLWDVTFGDLDDIAAVMAAEPGSLLDRDLCLRDLRDHIARGGLTTLNLAPGAALHVYMATGADFEVFSKTFQSPDVRRYAHIQDVFVLSLRPLAIDPDLVEEADWSFTRPVA